MNCDALYLADSAPGSKFHGASYERMGSSAGKPAFSFKAGDAELNGTHLAYIVLDTHMPMWVLSQVVDDVDVRGAYAESAADSPVGLSGWRKVSTQEALSFEVTCADLSVPPLPLPPASPPPPAECAKVEFRSVPPLPPQPPLHGLTFHLDPSLTHYLEQVDNNRTGFALPRRYLYPVAMVDRAYWVLGSTLHAWGSDVEAYARARGVGRPVTAPATGGWQRRDASGAYVAANVSVVCVEAPPPPPRAPAPAPAPRPVPTVAAAAVVTSATVASSSLAQAAADEDDDPALLALVIAGMLGALAAGALALYKLCRAGPPCCAASGGRARPAPAGSSSVQLGRANVANPEQRSCLGAAAVRRVERHAVPPPLAKSVSSTSSWA